MNKLNAFLGVLAAAVIAVACGSTDAGISTKVKNDSYSGRNS